MAEKSRDGLRDCKDIITAATAQGWTFKHRDEMGRTNSHSYLVPPNGGIPVGISGSPSDVHFRKQVIRLMRRQGFVWPADEADAIRRAGESIKDKVAEKDWAANRPWLASKVSTEEWRPIHDMKRYRLSNTGRVMEGDTELTPGPGGLFTLFDDNNRLREQYIRTMVRHHFGYGPIKVNPLITEFVNQEEAAVTTVEKEPTVATKIETDEEWRSLEDPRFETGWTLSSAGRLRRPNGTDVPGLPGATKNKNLIVAIRKATGGITTTRLDKLVLTTFGAPGPAGAHPVYLDGDVKNCTFDNLDWSESQLAAVPAPSDGQTGAALVAEVVAEIQANEPEPEPDYLQIERNLGELLAPEPEPEPEPEIEVPVEPQVEPEPVDPGPGPLSEEEGTVTGESAVEHQEKVRAEAKAEKAAAQKAAQDEAIKEHVKKVVGQAPSYSHPGLTVGQLEEASAVVLIGQGLFPRPLGALHQAEVNTLADVAKLSEQDLAKLPFMGPDTVDRLKILLAEHGLSLVEGPEVDWDKRKLKQAAARKRKSDERAKRKAVRQDKVAQRDRAIADEPDAPTGGVAQELSAYKGFAHVATGTETLVWEDGSFRLSINGDHVVDVEAEDAEVVLAVLTKVAEYRMVMGIK